jgi:TerC family integral membrane protein
LSVDNLFAFVLIFNYFKVPFEYQSRVLTYGIAVAVVFRAVMIGLGIASLQRFEGLNLIFAAILVFSSFKLVTGDDDDEEDLSDNFIVNLCRKLIPVTSSYDGNKFLTTVDGVRKATPLLLTLLVVELSDIAFAVDSIPAIFGVTRDPSIAYSSNIFAILGLRSLYTLISGNMAELTYLQPSVGVVLGFIGAKMIGEFCGIHVPTEASLGVVALVLSVGVSLSVLDQMKERRD